MSLNHLLQHGVKQKHREGLNDHEEFSFDPPA